MTKHQLKKEHIKPKGKKTVVYIFFLLFLQKYFHSTCTYVAGYGLKEKRPKMPETD